MSWHNVSKIDTAKLDGVPQINSIARFPPHTLYSVDEHVHTLTGGLLSSFLFDSIRIF